MEQPLSHLLLQAGHLIAHDRYSDAVPLLQRVVGEDPDSWLAHSLLGICLAETDGAVATQHAKTGIALEPESGLAHYSLAFVLFHRQHFRESEAAVDQALQVDPRSVGNWALKAQLCNARSDWEAAKRAAEQGLQLDPEDTNCANLRAVALRRLRQGGLAEQELRDLLARDPEDSTTHANLAMSLLERGQTREALEHFREALRLDPQSELAREGMLHALRSRIPPYKWMFRYFSWMSGFSPRHMIFIALGGVFLVKALVYLGRLVPPVQPFVMPLACAYILFAVSSWLAMPVTNLALMASRYGRCLLDSFQQRISLIVGACFLTGLVVVLWEMLPVPGRKMASGFFVPGMMLLGIALPISGLAQCDRGWPRWTGMAVTGVLALVLAGSFVAAVNQAVWGVPGQQWIAGFLEMHKDRLAEIEALPKAQQTVALRELAKQALALRQASLPILLRIETLQAYGIAILLTQLLMFWLAVQTVRK